jgi:hypothetical protein
MACVYDLLVEVLEIVYVGVIDVALQYEVLPLGVKFG